MNLQWKQITLYYWLHNDITIYRFTIIHFIPFFFFYCSTTYVFPCFEDPLNKWADLTRQTDPPSRPAKMSCHGNTPNPPANMTRQIHLPEIPPSLLKIPRQDMTCQPPPPTAPPTEQGEGARSRPGPPVHLEQVLLLSLECLHILTEHNIYAFYTERIRQVYKYITLGEGRVARRGWGAGLLPAPLKGVFCII